MFWSINFTKKSKKQIVWNSLLEPSYVPQAPQQSYQPQAPQQSYQPQAPPSRTLFFKISYINSLIIAPQAPPPSPPPDQQPYNQGSQTQGEDYQDGGSNSDNNQAGGQSYSEGGQNAKRYYQRRVFVLKKA